MESVQPVFDMQNATVIRESTIRTNVSYLVHMFNDDDLDSRVREHIVSTIESLIAVRDNGHRSILFPFTVDKVNQRPNWV